MWPRFIYKSNIVACSLALIFFLPLLTAYAQSSGTVFTQTLQIGSRNQEVTALQTYLGQFPDIYPEGLVTGYFGVLTEAAVKRFQTREGIQAVGIVGPITRTRLNALLSNTVLTPQPTYTTPQISSGGLTLSDLRNFNNSEIIPEVREIVTRQSDADASRFSTTITELSNRIDIIDTSGGASQWTSTGSDIYYDAGRVGIGNTAPSQKLVVAGDTSQTLKAGYLSVDNLLLSQLEGGSYFGGVGVKENQWALNNYGNTWTGKESSRNWTSVAMSSDGKIQAAVYNVGEIYISTDYGNTWTAKDSSRNWTSIAMNSDGKIQTAVGAGIQIYVSADYGNTWTAKESSRTWTGVAMSSDGKIQTATVCCSGLIYVSTDYGNTWTTKDSGRNWQGNAMSSDGKIQTAVVGSGQIYVSTDYGNTWTAKDSTRSWSGVAVSSDGKIQTAVVGSGQIYVSTDYGNTWTAKDSNRNWTNVAMSSDGKIQTAVASFGGNYVSTDYGNTWTSKDTNRNWSSVAMSSDGKIQTAVTNGLIYVSTADSYMPTGNVGIGTTTPSSLLSLAAAAGPTMSLDFTTDTSVSQFLFNQSGINKARFQLIGSNFATSDRRGDLEQFSTADISFWPGDTQTLTLKSTGSVAIGTTSPFAVGDVLSIGSAGFSTLLDLKPGTDATGGTYIVFRNAANSNIGSITELAGNSSVAYNTTSDQRLKENVIPTRYNLDDLMNIQVRDFSFISDATHTIQSGFIAQQLETVYPDAVTVGGDDPNQKPWSVDYGRLTPLLVKSIQDLNLKVDRIAGVAKDKICINNTCVTESELQALLLNAGINNNALPPQVVAAIPTPEPLPEPLATSTGSTSSLQASSVEATTTPEMTQEPIVPVAVVVEPTPAPLLPETGSLPKAICTFTRELHFGMLGEDVRCLQKYLNSQGFVVAASGRGSYGFENNHYGPGTESAVIRWQQTYGITPVTGNFGAKSRAAYLELTR